MKIIFLPATIVRNKIYKNFHFNNARLAKNMEDMHTVECNIPEFPDYGVNDGRQRNKCFRIYQHLNIFKKKIHGIDEENIEEAIKDAFMQIDNVWKDKSFKFVKLIQILIS
ncbi:unnamed protein product [Rhizophagus irregularis]|nr:unnamed protein product [Rhizophagus irregularis]